VELLQLVELYVIEPTVSLRRTPARTVAVRNTQTSESNPLLVRFLGRLKDDALITSRFRFEETLRKESAYIFSCSPRDDRLSYNEVILEVWCRTRI
jgi:hypothetical protein